jgi:ADP-ribose pyrophosphatase YjhB (NUDIX family)
MVLRRYPWSVQVIQRGYRLLQPRFSVGAVGVLLDAPGERVLLVEHVFHVRWPWGLPGGWMARGEDPAETVEREFREETGLRVRAVRPLLVQRTPEYWSHMDVVYLCAPDGADQTIRLSSELLNYCWAARDALPPLLAVHEAAILLAFASAE